MSSEIVDFESRLRLKRKKEALRTTIELSGWQIDSDVNSSNSDICMYLIDSEEKCVILYGCQMNQLLPVGHKDIIHWGHFVLAWDVIADPRMAFDQAHKLNTIAFSLRALPSLKSWGGIMMKINASPIDQKPHVLILIDRKNMDNPLEIIVAYSEPVVMNEASLNAIVKQYVDSV